MTSGVEDITDVTEQLVSLNLKTKCTSLLYYIVIHLLDLHFCRGHSGFYPRWHSIIHPRLTLHPKLLPQLHPGLSPRFHFTPLLRCAPEFYLDCPRVHPTPPLRLYTRLLPRLQPRFQPTPLLKFHPKLLPQLRPRFQPTRILRLHPRLLPWLHKRLLPKFYTTTLLRLHSRRLPGCTQTFTSLRPLLKLHLKLLPRLHIAALTRLHLRLFMLDFTSGIPKGPELLEWSDYENRSHSEFDWVITITGMSSLVIYRSCRIKLCHPRQATYLHSEVPTCTCNYSLRDKKCLYWQRNSRRSVPWEWRSHPGGLSQCSNSKQVVVQEFLRY